MPKRKPGDNDIIYELDNEDLKSSSDDHRTETKRACIAEKGEENALITTMDTVPCVNNTNSQSCGAFSSVIGAENGGKSLEDEIPTTNEDKGTETYKLETVQNENLDESSSAANAARGCENRSPLVTVTFRNKNIATNYKHKVKEFMLKLIKLHDAEGLTGSENETDIELDIWPEDLVPQEFMEEYEKPKEEHDGLFFVDTEPGCNPDHEIPMYCQNTTVMLAQEAEVEPEPPKTCVRRGIMCFNCDGEHPLRDCTLPRNRSRIYAKRQAMGRRVGRYHVEDDQKYGHLKPGRISSKLRYALGLRRDELPLHIYRMRLLGYPPGWLEDARISHSGLTMFDSQGKAVQDPEEEEGEVCEAGSKDIYDMKKIVDFPGFNVPASSWYREEGHRYGLPLMSERDSKLKMLEALAPNAMKAYKKKKMTSFPSASTNHTVVGQAEMELDDAKEILEFPPVPPLPDETPPLHPPLPDEATPLHPPPQDAPTPLEVVATPTNLPLEPGHAPEDNLVVESVMDVPADALLNGSDEEAKSQSSSTGRISPTLEDLEEKKRLLLEALDTGSLNSPTPSINPQTPPNTPQSSESLSITPQSSLINPQLLATYEDSPKSESTDETKPNQTIETPKSKSKMTECDESSPKAGTVTSTSLGTPILNRSPYTQLPSCDKFARDICDVINFENLPGSTGKFEKLGRLLKRVKSEVDRIQES